VADGRPHFYERHRWKAVAAVVALLGAIWALSGAPTPWKIASDLASNELPASNTMVVLDASKGMARPFGPNTTRLDVARRAVKRFTLPIENEGLALRTFGGACSGAGRVRVPFGAHHGDEVRDASAQEQPHGRSNLVNAVRAAIDDFADSDDFPERGPRRIVVFTGSVDECAGQDAARDIRADLEHSGVDATFRFVALKLGTESRRRLIKFDKALGRRSGLAFMETESDLETVDEWLGQKFFNVSECADGVDNDGDGRVDGNDPECASGSTEAPQQPSGECADGIDNDGDGSIDGGDPECASTNTEALQQQSGECADGSDNDGDGSIDGGDPECASGETESGEEPAGECADGSDNDGDGSIDAGDPECASGETESGEEPAGECADGSDNDGDGRIDEEDPGCAIDSLEASG
jgi:hypothetical protein